MFSLWRHIFLLSVVSNWWYDMLGLCFPMTTGKTIGLTRWTFVGKVISLLFNMLSAAAKSLQSCQTLCDPIDDSPPGSLVPGILQARTLEWVAISFSNAWKWKVQVKLLSRVWLSALMDCSLPGSSVHGIFQAIVLEWGAIAFSEYAVITLTVSAGLKQWLVITFLQGVSIF